MSPGSASASGHSLLVLTFALECWGFPTMLSVLFCQAFNQAPGWAAVGVEGGAKQRPQLPECADLQSLESRSDPLLLSRLRISLFLRVAKSGEFPVRTSGPGLCLLAQEWTFFRQRSNPGTLAQKCLFAFCRACGTTL